MKIIKYFFKIIILSILINTFIIKINKNVNNKYINAPEKMRKNKISELFPKLVPQKNKITKTNLNQFYNSRELLINDKNITKEYIHLLKPIKYEKEKKYNIEYSDLNFYNYTSKKKKGIISSIDFYNICKEEILIDKKKYELPLKPLISIILPVYNKKDELMISLRSIQNQSFKEIEIIIVDDESSDNINDLYDNLMKDDPRIRIFKHSKNMGVWRSRLDGFLYSKGEYILHFDPSDIYADNYVLEEAYNMIKKYNLDSIRFSLSKTDIDKFKKNKKFEPMMVYPLQYTKIIYGTPHYDVHIFGYGTIWNRLIKSNIFSKALELVDEFILNAYKNLWEDMWWNDLVDRVSFSNLIVNRLGYIYFFDEKGAGSPKINSRKNRNKTIQEFIYFWFFDLQLLPKKDNKRMIIQKLYDYNNPNNKFYDTNISLNYLNSKFPIYERLLSLLFYDPFVRKKNKYFIMKLYLKYKKIQKVLI